VDTLNSILNQLVDVVVQSITPEAAQQFIALRACEKDQELVNQFAQAANEGRLNEDDRATFVSLIIASEFIALVQIRARAILAKSSRI